MGFCYQETSHSSFHNAVESVRYYGRGGYRSQTSLSPSYNQGMIVISLGFYINVNGIVGQRFHTRNLPSCDYGGL